MPFLRSFVDIRLWSCSFAWSWSELYTWVAVKRVYFRLTEGAGKSQNYKGRDIFRCFLAHSNLEIRWFVFTAPGFDDIYTTCARARARALHYVSFPRSDRVSLIQSTVLYFFYVTQHEWTIFMLGAGGGKVEKEEEEERDACTDSSSYIGRSVFASHIASNYSTFRWACPTDIPTLPSFILLKAFLPRSSSSLPRAEGSFF